MLTRGVEVAGTTVRSRRLARILSDYRKAAGKTQAEAARYVGRTTPWVSRNETAATCRPSVGDVRSLLDFYGVTDPAVVEQVIALAREVKEPGWWHGHNLSSAHEAFVALEAEASAKLAWEPSLIPGLLQVAGYARVVIAAGPDPLAPGRIEELVRVRAERQKILHRVVPLVADDIIAESVLHCVVGTPALMREQLGHLLRMMEEPHVTVRILPSSAGAHGGMTGPFTILQFADEADHDIVYGEAMTGGVYAEEPESLERAHRVFGNLGELALSPEESADLIASVLSQA